MSAVFNLFDGELDEEGDRPGFSWRRAKVGAKIGAEKLGASLYELEPGERSFPYHYEYGVEEWLLCRRRTADAAGAGWRARAAPRRRCLLPGGA